MDLQFSFIYILELEIEDPKVLSSLFLNIIDGLIIDGTINKPEINSEETWSYINKLIELETKQNMKLLKNLIITVPYHIISFIFEDERICNTCSIR
ncbi:hypothetical protein BANRA_00852 [Acinetobacter baumannii]|nr:hypothetical protein BANRA_00852 [Acinetobacter baumannii]